MSTIDRLAARLRVVVRRGPSSAAASGPTDDEIRREGLVGRATVVDIRPTGRQQGDRHELEIRLDVLIPTRRRFEATIRDWLADEEASGVVVGHPVSVAADRAEPGHVVLVLTDHAVNPAAIASFGRFAGGPGGPKPTDEIGPAEAGPDADR